jgi:hypothetical protein
MNLLASARFTAVSAALLGSVACGSANTPTQPPAPVYELKTDLFAGTVATGGSKAFMFTVVNPGDISVAITELGPTSTLVMGLSLGFWEAATQTCVEQLRTTTATVNVAFAATPSSPGEYCAGVFDTGNVVITSDFTLKVTHY